MDDGERTRSSPDIVQSQLSDARVQLEEKGERLANATSSTEDGDLGQLKKSICQHCTGNWELP